MKTSQATVRNNLQGSIGTVFCGALAKYFSQVSLNISIINRCIRSAALYLIKVRLQSILASELLPIVQLQSHFASELLPIVRLQSHFASELLPIVRLQSHFASELLPIVRLQSLFASELLPIVRLQSHFASELLPIVRLQSLNVHLDRKTIVLNNKNTTYI